MKPVTSRRWWPGACLRRPLTSAISSNKARSSANSTTATRSSTSIRPAPPWIRRPPACGSPNRASVSAARARSIRPSCRKPSPPAPPWNPPRHWPARQQYEATLNGARQSWGAVENSQASLAGVRSQLAQSEKALADTTIRAPFDGFITARPVAVGQYVALSNKIATIMRIGTMKLDLQTPEQRAARGKLGMTVLARVAAYPDREFSGTVTAVDPSVDPNS